MHHGTAHDLSVVLVQASKHRKTVTETRLYEAEPVACRLWVYWRLSPVDGCGGCPVAVASGHEGTGQRVPAATDQRLGVRQRAGAGGCRLGHGHFGSDGFRAGGQGRTRRRARLRVWAGVATYLT